MASHKSQAEKLKKALKPLANATFPIDEMERMETIEAIASSVSTLDLEEVSSFLKNLGNRLRQNDAEGEIEIVDLLLSLLGGLCFYSCKSCA